VQIAQKVDASTFQVVMLPTLIFFHSAGLHFQVDLGSVIDLAVDVKPFQFFMSIADWEFNVVNGGIDYPASYHTRDQLHKKWLGFRSS
jgi:hypothetical protein